MNDFGKYIDTQTVTIERVLSGSVDDVWAYLTDPDKRRTWLAFGPMELKVGGKVVLMFDFSYACNENPPERFRSIHQNGHTVRGQVTLCEPPHLLAFTWDEKDGTNSEVRFDLQPQGEKTVLTVTHFRLRDRGEMVSVSSGWHTHLGILESRLENRPQRLFWNTFLEVEAEYEKRIPQAETAK